MDGPSKERKLLASLHLFAFSPEKLLSSSILPPTARNSAIMTRRLSGFGLSVIHSLFFPSLVKKVQHRRISFRKRKERVSISLYLHQKITVQVDSTSNSIRECVSILHDFSEKKQRWWKKMKHNQPE